MLDDKTIRHQLAEIENRLAQMDDERLALQDIAKGFRALLKATSAPDQPSSEHPAFPQLPLPKKTSTIVGSVSMRSAVARVLQQAGARPMHSRDVYAGAQRLGAATTAKDPTSVVDLVIFDLHKKGLVEKVGPRTWRWIKGG